MRGPGRVTDQVEGGARGVVHASHRLVVAAQGRQWEVVAAGRSDRDRRQAGE